MCLQTSKLLCKGHHRASQIQGSLPSWLLCSMWSHPLWNLLLLVSTAQSLGWSVHLFLLLYISDHPSRSCPCVSCVCSPHHPSQCKCGLKTSSFSNAWELLEEMQNWGGTPDLVGSCILTRPVWPTCTFQCEKHFSNHAFPQGSGLSPFLLFPR